MNLIDNFNRLKNNKLFNKIIIAIILFVILLISCFFMLRYQVEGEKNLPFKLSKIIVVSSAEGKDIENSEIKWNFNLVQNNDFYISINKSEDYEKSQTIKSVKIENIEINKENSNGDIKNYKPAEDGLFVNDDKYIIQDSLEYLGNITSDINELKIGNQGGTIIFRSANIGVGTYSTNDDEIAHDGKLLSKAGITDEQLNYSIKFDIIIETGKGIKYKGIVDMKLPQGSILTDGRGYLEKTDFDDVIFKRI